MKAAVYEKYGAPDVVQIVDVPKPTPKDNEVLIKIYATTVAVGDSRMRRFDVPTLQWIPARLYLGIFKPRRSILGMELAGKIEAIGSAVTQFKVGDDVFASTFAVSFGAHAEYKCIPEDGLVALKPTNLDYGEAAAAVGSGMTTLRILKRGKIQRGQKVLIYGASGSIGSNAVQLVKNHYGAEVTAVCSTANVEWVKALGADRVIDYKKDDFTKDGAIYDVVFDAVAKIPATEAKKALKPDGIYLNAHRDSDGDGALRSEELITLKNLIEADKLKPYIDRRYPLAEIVAAHRYVDDGHKKGNVVITVA